MTDNAKILRRVAVVTFVANVLLFVLKLVTGLIFNNLAVKADAWHSATDVIMPLTIFVISFFIGAQSDKKHNYGHERVETIFTLILALLIGGVGIMLGVEGVHGIIEPGESNRDWLLIVVTIISLVIKEATFVYGISYAKKIHSETLRINAWHSCLDGLSSVAVLIGLLCSKFTDNNLFESIAVIVVALLIVKVAIETVLSSSSQLVDRAVNDAEYNQIKAAAIAVDGVKQVTNLCTRRFGNRVCVDIEIAVDGNLTVDKSYEIVMAVQQKLLTASELNIKNCTVQVCPNR